MSESMMMSARSRQIEFFEIADDFRPSSSEAHHAKTSPAPTQKAKVSKANEAASTSKPSGSSESAALVGSLLRTALISELGELTPSSLHWRHSATPAGRSWFVLATSEPTMSARGAGSSDATSAKLPTPVSQSQNGGMRWEGGAGGRKVLKETGLMDAIYGRLSTPRASDMKAGGHGDTGRMGTVRHQLQKAMLHTPTTMANFAAPSMQKWESCKGWAIIAEGTQEKLPTPTKRDKRMDAWSPAYDKRKSPTMDAVLDGAMTDRSPDKWAYARQIASTLQASQLTGPSMTLPITYGWMMGFPPGWLARALQSAVQKGHLQQVLSLKRSVTRSSRKSRKQSAAQS